MNNKGNGVVQGHKDSQHTRLINDLRAEVKALRLERETVLSRLDRADQRMQALEDRLEDAEHAWGHIRDLSADHPARISGLEHALPEVHPTPQQPATDGTDQSDELPIGRLRLICDDTLTADASVEVDSDTTPPPSLLEDDVLFDELLFVDDDSGNDAADDDHRATVASGRPRRQEEDSILADLNVTGIIRTARVRMFVAMDDEFPGTEFALDKPVVTIGRSKQSDIRLQNLVVSRTHARLKADADGVVVEDAGSRNGITVNSRVVSRARLHDGDVVSLGGKLDFRYVELELPPAH